MKTPKKLSTIVKQAIKQNIPQIQNSFHTYDPNTKTDSYCIYGLLEQWNFEPRTPEFRKMLDEADKKLEAEHNGKGFVNLNDDDHWTFQQFEKELRRLGY